MVCLCLSPYKTASEISFSVYCLTVAALVSTSSSLSWVTNAVTCFRRDSKLPQYPDTLLDFLGQSPTSLSNFSDMASKLAKCFESEGATFWAKKRQKVAPKSCQKRATILIKGATVWDIFLLGNKKRTPHIIFIAFLCDNFFQNFKFQYISKILQ